MCQYKTNTNDAKSLCSQGSRDETMDNEVESSSCPSATGIGAHRDPCIEEYTLQNEHECNMEICTEKNYCVKTNPQQTFCKNISNNRFLISFFSCFLILISMLNTLLSLHIHPGNYQDLWSYITYTNDLADVNNDNDDPNCDEPDEQESECGRSYALKGGIIKGLKVNFFEISPKHGEKAQKSDMDSIKIGDDHLKILTEKETHAVLRRAEVFRLQIDYISNPHSIFFPAFSSLTTYLDRVQNGSVSQDEEMCYEVRRFQSYNSVPVRASPMRLARSGFYATGSGDETRCYSCRMTYRDWRLMDHPDQIHRSMSPDCPHLNNTDQRNIPMSSSASDSDVTTVRGVIGEYPIINGSSENVTYQPEAASTSVSETSATSSTSTETPALTGLDISKAVYPQYRDVSSRLDSYQGWGWSHVQDPQVLARAGFYYAGYRDCVRCFYCGVGLRTWEREDDPWVEHVRWRSSCDYVRLMKGEQFAIQALTKNPSVPSSYLAPVPTRTPNSLPIVKGDGNDARTKAMEMGFQRDQVDRAVADLTRSQSGAERTDVIQLETLLEKLMSDDMATLPTTTQSSSVSNQTSPSVSPGSGEELTDVNRSSRATISRTVTSLVGFAADDTITTSVTNQKAVGHGLDRSHSQSSRNTKDKKKGEIRKMDDDHNAASEVTERLSANQERQLEEENQSLRDEGTCKICLDNPSCIVFLPCGHLVTCAECAPALSKCPICRALIRGTVRAHTVSSDHVNM